MTIDEMQRIVASEFGTLPSHGRRRYRAALNALTARTARWDAAPDETPWRVLRLHRLALAASRRAYYVGETASGLCRRV